MYMQFNLDFNDNENTGRFDFAKEAERIQEENSTKEAELFLGKFESEECYREERKKIADQYHVLYPENIEFRDNDWYMKDNQLTVKEWDEVNDTNFDYKSGHK